MLTLNFFDQLLGFKMCADIDLFYKLIFPTHFSLLSFASHYGVFA